MRTAMRWLAASLWGVTGVVVLLVSLPVPVSSVPVSVVLIFAGCVTLAVLIGRGGQLGLVAASLGTVLSVLATLLVLFQAAVSNTLVAVVIGAIFITLNGLAVWELAPRSPTRMTTP
jgi:hypothetical protein